MRHGKDIEETRSEPDDAESVRWRPWPCEICSGGSTPIDFIVSRFDSSPESAEQDRNQVIDRFKDWEAKLLLAWVETCQHTQWSNLSLPKLAMGSEHLVLIDEIKTEVLKVTLPSTYGDYYELIDGKINQFDLTPAGYLIRMILWEELFSLAPNPIGMTKTGQIVSRQQFIQGDANPAQEKVDQFLENAGMVAVKRHCWLWKRKIRESGIEIWVGDARSDNFVLTEKGMVPIDIRIWEIPLEAEEEETR